MNLNNNRNNRIQEINHYQFKEKHNIGLNILPEYYRIIINFSQGNINKYLEYLYCKYYKNLLRNKVTQIKKSATTQYQPETNKYLQIKFKKINPYIWDKYKDLKRMSGYSISFIIRTFLEWEIQERNQTEILERGYPLIPFVGERNALDYSNFFLRHSYVMIKKGNSQNRSIYMKLLDSYG